ncbi:MAG: hypothetical protein KY475_05180 [Planctomycetes bacterium]|nr:hypothetical protein [Planctomycetota bacterium]
MIRPSNEERISALEHEVAELKKAVASQGQDDWIAKITGSFENNSDFDEIVRLGQEIGRSDRPPADGD